MMVSLRSPVRGPLSSKLTQLESVELSAPVTRKFCAVGSASGKVSGVPVSIGQCLTRSGSHMRAACRGGLRRVRRKLIATLRPFSPAFLPISRPTAPAKHSTTMRQLTTRTRRCPAV